MLQPTCLPRDHENAADRLARWKTDLLDLSIRNRLLNFKDSKKSIPLLCPSIAGLEDALAVDVIDRVPSLGSRAAYAKQFLRDKLLGQKGYIDQHGRDLLKIFNLKWKG